jgi:hypothetical protein
VSTESLSREQRKALKRVRKAAMPCRHTLARASAVGLSERGRALIAKRDDAIRKALLLGCSWEQVIFGPGTGCFTDLYDETESALRIRFGAAAEGMLAEQERHAELVRRAEDSEAHCLSSTDVWGHLLLFRGYLRDGNPYEAVHRRDGVYPHFSFEQAKTAARAIEALMDRVDEVDDFDREELEWGWTPETKGEFWAAMEALERRVVAALLTETTAEEVSARVRDIEGLVIGDRKANLAALGPVKLTPEEATAPTYGDWYRSRWT